MAKRKPGGMRRLHDFGAKLGPVPRGRPGLKPELVKRVLQLGREKLAPKQIVAAIAEQGKSISLGSVYRLLGPKPTKVSMEQIAKCSAATAIKKEQLKVALRSFQSCSLTKKLQRLNELNKTKLRLEKAIQSLDQANLSRPWLQDAIQSEQCAKTRESALAKLKQLESLIEVFCQYVPKAELKKTRLDFKEH